MTLCTPFSVNSEVVTLRGGAPPVLTMHSGSVNCTKLGLKRSWLFEEEETSMSVVMVKSGSLFERETLIFPLSVASHLNKGGLEDVTSQM